MIFPVPRKDISINKENDANFEAFFAEYRERRENVLNILKIVIEQNQIESFQKYITSKDDEIKNEMKNFIKSKYYEFVESIGKIKECKSAVKSIDDIVTAIDNKIQEFLSGFKVQFIERIRKKEELKMMIREKEKLNCGYLLFVYLNKVDIAIKEQQFELSLRLMEFVNNKILSKIYKSSLLYQKGEFLLTQLKNKILSILGEKVAKWLLEIEKEQKRIGETLYKKVKFDAEKSEKRTKSFGNSEKGSKSIRASKQIMDSLQMIRNTSNLNYTVSKNSILKSSMAELTEYNDEYDIINMVSNLDLKFLEFAYNIFKALENEGKLIGILKSFRKNQVQSLFKYQDSKENVNKFVFYEKFFSEILGFLVVQVSIYDSYPNIFSKKKTEDEMKSFAKDLENLLSFRFDTFSNSGEFLNIERSIFVFLNSIERIAIEEKIGVDLKSLLFEILKEKIMSLNLVLISSYNSVFSKMLLDESEEMENLKEIDDFKKICLIVNNSEEFLKYTTQYCIKIDDNKSNTVNLIYPFKLPYTKFVIQVNEGVKKYIDELFEYVRPLYSDYEGIIPEMVRLFLQKLNEVFLFFTNHDNKDIEIIKLGQICNNIKYLLQSHEFYLEYVKKTCNIKAYISIYSEKSLKKAEESFEEVIYEILRERIREHLETWAKGDWMPLKPRTEVDVTITQMKIFLTKICTVIQSLNNESIESCFKDALKFTSKIIIELLFNPKVVSNYNYYAIENTKRDVNELETLFREIDIKSSFLTPVINLLEFFENKNFNELITKNDSLEPFYKLNINEFARFLTRFKNIKGKGPRKIITESEINSILKKNKHLLSK